MPTKQQLEQILNRVNKKLEKQDRELRFKPVDKVKDKVLKNALKRYAEGCKPEHVVAVWDTTLFGSGKSGYLLATDGLYSDDFPKFSTMKGTKIPFADLKRVDYVFEDGETEEDVSTLLIENDKGARHTAYASIYAVELKALLDAVIALREDGEKKSAPAPEAKAPAEKKAVPAAEKKDAAKPAAEEKKAAPVTEKKAVPKPVPAEKIAGPEENPAEGYRLPTEAVKLLKGKLNPNFMNQLYSEAGADEAELACRNREENIKRYEAGLKLAEECKNQQQALNKLQAVYDYWQPCYADGMALAANSMAAFMLAFEIGGNDLLIFQLARMAAAADLRYGLFNLGYCYYHGIGVEKDVDEAASLFAKAADRGVGDACMHFVQALYGNPYRSTTDEELWELLCIGADCLSEDGALLLGKFYAKGMRFTNVRWEAVLATLRVCVRSRSGQRKLEALDILLQCLIRQPDLRNLELATIYLMQAEYLELPGAAEYIADFDKAGAELSAQRAAKAQEPRLPAHEVYISKHVGHGKTKEDRETVGGEVFTLAAKEELFELHTLILPLEEIAEGFKHGYDTSDYEIAYGVLDGARVEVLPGFTGIDNDRELHITMMELAAGEGFAPALTALGILHLMSYDEKEYGKAWDCLSKAAEQDYPEALYCVGYCYRYGYGVEKDREEWIRYTLLSSILGCSAGSMLMAHLYYKGEHVEKDCYVANHFTRRAAEQGHVWASICYGSSYHRYARGDYNIGDLNWYGVIAGLIKGIFDGIPERGTWSVGRTNLECAYEYLFDLLITYPQYRNLEFAEEMLNLAEKDKFSMTKKYRADYERLRKAGK